MISPALLLLLLLLASTTVAATTARTPPFFPTPVLAKIPYFPNMERRRHRPRYNFQETTAQTKILKRPLTDLNDKHITNKNHINNDSIAVVDKTTDDDDDDDGRRCRSQQPWSKFWPPWPFTMWEWSTIDHQHKDGRHGDNDDEDIVLGVGPNNSKKKKKKKTNRCDYSALAHFWTLSKRSAQVAARNVQDVGSQLWYHFPPAVPPLLLLACFPRRQQQQTVLDTAVATISTMAATDPTTTLSITKTVIPLWSNPFVRSVALTGAGLAFISWGHSELNKKRRLTALPLNERYRDINRAILPPFLPEAASMPMPSFFSHTTDNDDNDDSYTITDGDQDADSTTMEAMLPPRLRRHWRALVENTPKTRSFTTGFRDWRRMRMVRRCERRNAQRLAIFNELVTLQELKSKNSNKNKIQRNNKRKPTAVADTKATTTTSDLGYALVTGASKGIGRALAVELARWEIPLILVARDSDALSALGKDLEMCYGVDCYVLPADLTLESTAKNLYRTVKKAGLKVDILINNAGIAAYGDILDHSLEDIDKIVQVNTRSLLALTHLFGQDMREQRRGRVLMVSSVCGSVSGIASVAVYSATKAFANSFSMAFAKEMEPYGVGVTCLVPGAVKGTDFRVQSKSSKALCWKLPYYSKSAESVAEAGIRAMLHGDVEVTPGIMNRLFLKIAKPLSPQRLHNLMAEVMWKPIEIPHWLGMQSKTSKRNTPPLTFVDEVEEPIPLETKRMKPLLVRPAGLLYEGLPKSRMLELDTPPVLDLSNLHITTAENDSSSSATTSRGIHGVGNETIVTAFPIQDPNEAGRPTEGFSIIKPALDHSVPIQAQNSDGKPSFQPLGQLKEQDGKHNQILESETIAKGHKIISDPKTLDTSPNEDASMINSSIPCPPSTQTEASDDEASELELLLNLQHRQRSTKNTDPAWSFFVYPAI